MFWLSKREWLVIFGVGSILWPIFVFLIYHQIFELSGFPSDTHQHIDFAKDMINDIRLLPHPFWHIGTAGIALIFNIDFEYSAWIVSVLILIFLTILVVVVVVRRLPSRSMYIHIPLIISIMIVAPMYIPGISHYIYMGVGSPSVWHNVTLWSVKPIGLLTLVIAVKAFTTNNKIFLHGILMLVLLISMIAKPSFMMIFLPAFTVWVFLKNYHQRLNLLSLLSMWIGALIVLMWQVLMVNEGDNQVIIDFLGVWSIITQDIGLSIVTALAFPLIYIIGNSKALQDDNILLISWGMVFSGLIIAMLFAEKGERYLDGNFMWGYILALFYLYLFSVISFVQYWEKISVTKRYFMLSVWIYQTVVGVVYLAKILNGESIV